MLDDINATDTYYSKFRDEYYQSSDGGWKAALDLQAWVRDYLGKAQPALASLPIMIKAFANEAGLSKFLVNYKVIGSASSLLDFAKQFSQAHPISDFVLVDNGKERVDKKIQGETISYPWSLFALLA